MPNILTRERERTDQRNMLDKTSSDKRQMAIERCASSEATEGPFPVRVITLNHGEHQDSTLYRFEKGCYLQFCPGPSLLGKKVFLYTNHVPSDGQGDKSEEVAEFVRNQYTVLEWRRDAPALNPLDAKAAPAAPQTVDSLGAGALITDTDLYCELRLQRAGSFHFYYVYDNAESAVGPQGSGWFQTAPTVRAGGSTLPLDGLMCQTVLTKCLGPLTRWERVLRVAYECGYNMLHFSPVQQLGASGSSYSIADQLRPNPAFGADVTFADVQKVVAKLRDEWGIVSICDVVLNHTANETQWLAEHPDATYNCANCPYLRPAALLDAALARFGADVALGRYAARGAPPCITHEHHLDAIRRLLLDEVLPELRLHEMFTCDVDELVQQFLRLARNKVPALGEGGERSEEGDGGQGALKLVADEQRRRLRASVDMERALQLFNVYKAECHDEETRLAAGAASLRRELHRLNAAAADELRDHLRAAVDNCLAGVRYQRLQPDGPRLTDLGEATPLVPRYFTGTHARADGSPADAETLVYGTEGRLCMAHNGWVMNADPLQDFAAREQHGRVYLRRELIAWGDSVKLRYGDGPEDSPFLWAHMGRYVTLTAELFDGLRLDNCHSTPLHVAEHMLDLARNVKPDLYVVAELFTNSDHVDNIFVNRLGITSLIREALAAWDAHEQGRLVHRFGGRAAGAFLRPRRRAARPRVARAMLLDLTHDNPSPLDKRCVFDMLPSTALVAMACCATGSTRGYDELVPHHVHVVDEQRLYAEWGEGEGRVSVASGLVAAKRALNRLHLELAAEGYSEVFVDQMDPDVVAVTRHEPRSRRSVVLVARTAFGPPDTACGGRSLRPLRVEGQLDEILLEAGIVHKDHRVTGQPYRQPGEFNRHPHYIHGLTEYEASVRTAVPLAHSAVFREMRVEGAYTVLEFKPLAPGAVVAVRVSPRPTAAAALARLTALTDALHCSPADADPLSLAPALADLDSADFNRLLYQCDAEERDCGGGGVYDVPGHGPLVYAGVQGAVSLLAEVTPVDDLGHPLCDNLRAGDWLVEYAWKRLDAQPRLAPVARRYRELFRPLADAPRFLVPAYYAALIGGVHAALIRAALARAPSWVRADSFARALALTSVQLAGAVPSAALPAPAPPRALTLSAGLPHFAVGYMRCWGRDTFIALRGMFLLTGRFVEAREHILGFGACLRHGLIPNLLDGGRNARYNCRDAVWWWLYSIEQYCVEAPEGLALLTAPVTRLFTRDDGDPSPVECPLHDLMQEALDVHFQGLVFRERNAGRTIDAHMTDKGFNVQIGIDPDTGFPFGGNDANCGTWMDKMGSSEVAGNRGRPATPRDGSAVELVALAHRCATWLAAQHRAARYPYPGVARRHRDGALTAWTFDAWAERLRTSFERHFWVPLAPSAADPRPDLVHRRGIYKDSHGASQPWADYQLRCNFPVAMAISPDLFDPKRAWRALDIVERVLLGPLGIKTLDPADWAYRPDYNNSDDSTDPSVAHGFNYHQGPEWLWPVGFYLRARLAFALDNGRLTRTVADVFAALAPHHAEIRSSPWRGLPELTNAGGAYCADSCRTQAWSSAVMLEVLHDLNRARRARPLLPAD